MHRSIRLARPLLVIAMLAALLAVATDARPASAAPDDFTLTKAGPADVLIGEIATFTITAEGTQGTDLYNISFRDVLPAGITYVPGSGVPSPAAVIAIPGGTTTLVWSNTDDLPSNSKATVSYQVDTDEDYNPATAPVGTSFANSASAYAHANAFLIPQYDPATGEFAPMRSDGTTPNFTGEAAASTSTPIKAFRLTKSGGGELLRGVHDNGFDGRGGTPGTEFELEVENNPHYPTTGFTVDDSLDSYLEFLGCTNYYAAGTDHSTSVPFRDLAAESFEEWDGSGRMADGPAGCRTPNSVSTVDDGSGVTADTDVTWGTFDLAAAETEIISYQAGIPMRQNCLTWPAGASTTGLTQGRNLDNNCGPSTNEDDITVPNPDLPELLSTSENDAVNQAQACGTYFGTSICEDDEQISSSEDIVIGKAMTGVLNHGTTVPTSLTVSTSEYRDFTNLQVRDLLPAELDGPFNSTITVGATTTPITPTDVNSISGGRLEIIYDFSTITGLEDLDSDSELVIAFDTIVRSTRRDSGVPIRSGDTSTNEAEVWGPDFVVSSHANDGGADDEADGGPDGDTTSAGITNSFPSIKKYVAVKTPGPLDNDTAPDPVTATTCRDSYAAITWEDSAAGAPSPSDVNVTGYSPGDVTCFLLTASFPSLMDYGSVRITDLMPPGYTYLPGSAQRITVPTSSTTDGSTVPADTLTTTAPPTATPAKVVFAPGSAGEVDDLGQQFTWVIGAVLGPPGAAAPGDITVNQQKMVTSNTAGDVFQFRDMAGAVWEQPVVDLAKGIESVTSPATSVAEPGPLGIDDDESYADGTSASRLVEAGADVRYRIDVWNRGNRDAGNVEVWDLLPAGIECSDVIAIDPVPGTVSPIGDGTCVGDGSGADPYRIEWPALGAVAATLGQAFPPTSFVTYHYTVRVPLDIEPAVAATNTAGVRSYTAPVNYDGDSDGNPDTFSYWPADNIDTTSSAPTPNTTEASDTAVIVTEPLRVEKTQWSGIDEAGNGSNGAPGSAPDTATVGEIIQYRITTTVPEGTTVYDTTLSDTLPAGVTYFAGNGLFDGSIANLQPTVTVTGGNATTDGTPTLADASFPAVGTTGPVTLTFPDDDGDTQSVYRNATASGDDEVTITFYVQVADLASNDAGGTIQNSATAAYTDAAGTARPPVNSNTVTTSTGEPNPTITKTHTVPAGNIAGPNDLITFRLAVTNPTTGASNVSVAHDLVVVDTVPPGVSVLATPGGAPVADGGTVTGPSGSVGVWQGGTTRTITWDSVAPAPDVAALDEIDPDGTPVVLDFDVRVDDPAPAGLEILNTAVVTADNLPPEDPNVGDGRSYTDNDTDRLDVAEPTIDKDLEPFGSPDPGDNRTYTVGQPAEFAVTVTVPDATIAYDATVFDLLPTGVDFDEFSHSTLAVGSVGPNCYLHDGTLPPTDTYLVGDIAPLAPPIGGLQVAWYLGDVIADGGDCEITLGYTVHVNDTAFAGDTYVNRAELVSNSTDELPDTLIGGQLPTDYDDPDGDWNNDTTPVAEQIEIVEPSLAIDKDVALLPTPLTMLPPCDVTPGNSDDPDGTAASSPSGATDGDGCDVESGSTMRYNLTVTNRGSSAAHDITITDVVPDGLSPLDPGGDPVSASSTIVASPSGGPLGTWDVGTRTITWTVAGPVAAATGPATLDYDAELGASDAYDDDEDLTNVADVPTYYGIPSIERSQIAADNPANDDILTYGSAPGSDRGPVAPDEVTIELHFPDLSIAKQPVAPSDAGDARLDEPFTWEFTITNLDTAAAAYDVDAADILPPGWTYVPGSAVVTTPYNGGPVVVEPTCTADTGVCNDPNALNTETLSWIDLTSGPAQPLDAGQSIVVELQAIPQEEVLDTPTSIGAIHTNTARTSADDVSGSGSCCGGVDYEDETTNDVVLQRFDLAIQKRFAGFDTTDLGVGSKVSFDIDVHNQGSVDATDVTITDYVQNGFVFNAADNTAAATGNTNDWDGADPSNPTLDVGAITAGGLTSVTIVLEFIGLPSGADGVDNFVEISTIDDDGDPGTGPPLDVDSTPDAVNDEFDAGDPDNDATVDNVLDNTDGDEDDHDIASIDVFDLALRKTVDSIDTGALRIGSKVTFTLEVVNQGSVDATDVTITDYVQNGFVFNAADNTATATGNTNDWDSTDPSNPTLDVGDIAADSSTTVEIALEYVGGADVAENRAEISSADDDGNPTTTAPTDVDSRPDATDGENPVDDEIDQAGIDGNGNPTGDDEDDHDIASIPVFDLALRKSVDSIDTVDLRVGSKVTFELEVFNQGSVDATDVLIADYVQSGFVFNAADNTAAATGNTNDWNGTDPTEPTLVVGDVANGASTTVAVVLEWRGGVAMAGNAAEIASADDDANPTTTAPVDVDSDADLLDDDDVEDDEIDENGRDDTSGDGIADEDDHDVATIPVFDLALRKTFVSQDSASLTIGTKVTFGIEVVNQGSVDATDVEVTDYVQDGFVFNAADNTAALTGNTDDWNGADPTNPTLQVGALAAGDSTTVFVTLEFATEPAGTARLRNLAEISDADDDDNVTTPAPVDHDSTRDTDPGDALEDDEIDENGVDDTTGDGIADEDDHDVVDLDVFDLALRKTRTSIAPDPIEVGSLVTYQLEVFNQGSVDAFAVKLTDYVAPGFEFSPGDNPGWDGTDLRNPTIVIPALAAGDTTTVSIVLEFVGGVAVAENTAEIRGADDDGDPGNQPPVDVDSVADATNADPVEDDEIDEDGATDTSGDGIADEDDHDIDRLPVFDLALQKRFVAASTSPIANGTALTYEIDVINQGGIDATDVVISDYVASETTFDPADNTASETGNGVDWDGTVPTNPTLAVGTLAAGDSVTVTIVLEVTALPAGPGTLRNTAEIASADDDGNAATVAPTDVDSAPDRSDDDAVEDDELDENGRDDTTGDGIADEDDHDVADLTFPAFDLALTKSLAPGQDAIVDPDEDITFRITVTNQGEIDAYEVEVVEYLPVGLVLSNDDTNGWFDNGDGTLSNAIPGPIAVGTSASIDLDVSVQDGVRGDLVNLAEIAAAEDVNGAMPIDIDSTPDAVSDNDGDPVDDAIDNRDGDEDDHDLAPIRIREVDLEITKTGASTVETGEDAAWTITVSNLGPDEDPGPIVVTDDLPAGLGYVSAAGDGWQCGATGQVVTCTSDTPIPSGESAPPITVITNVTASTGEVTNSASVESGAADDVTTNDADIAASAVRPPTPSPPTPSPLASTGARVAGTALLAMLLMSVGFVLTRRARRRSG